LLLLAPPAKSLIKSLDRKKENVAKIPGRFLSLTNDTKRRGSGRQKEECKKEGSLMLWLWFASGETRVLENGVKVAIRNGTFACLDNDGDTLASFPAREVLVYTTNPETARMINTGLLQERLAGGSNS
jgi:hypothetical protein